MANVIVPRVNEIRELGFKFTAITHYQLQTPSALITISVIDIAYYSEEEWNKLIKETKERLI